MKNDDLAFRIAALEKFREEIEASVDIEIGTQIRSFSRSQALEAVVIELAIQAGVSEDRVTRRLEGLQQRFHDQYLQQAEIQNSTFAAGIDNRDVSEVPTDQGEGKLFPPTTD